MTRNRAALIAWSLAAFAIVATGIELWLLVLGPGLPLNDPDRAAAIDYLAFLLFVVVGALVATKRPSNAVGWLILAYVVWGSVVGVAVAYGERGVLIEPGSLPAAGAAVWLASWLWGVHFVLLASILLRFPTGDLLSPRWRWAEWCCVLPVVMFGVAAVGWLEVPARRLLTSEWEAGLEWLGVVWSGAFGILTAIILVAVVSLIVRFRRSAYEERQQLKWVILAAILLLASGIWSEYLGGDDDLRAAAGALAFAAIPASMGVAILKYRLYAIDRIINKTLVYGLLTALLLTGYAGGVLLIQTVLPVPESSPAVVAGSTLAMAALFGPLRGRIQDVVDRRFYRSRYDAITTVRSFEASVRRQTDLDGLTTDLAAAVQRTVHPSHVSVWLMDARKETS